MTREEMMVIVRHVSARTGFKAAELLDISNRFPTISRARWLIWHLMRCSGIGWSETARLFPCNHSSVIYGVRALRKGRTETGATVAQVIADDAAAAAYVRPASLVASGAGL